MIASIEPGRYYTVVNSIEAHSLSGYEPWLKLWQKLYNSIGIEAFSKTSLLVPRLKEDGSNWVLYCTQLQDYLCGQKGYRKHLTGRAKAPNTARTLHGELHKGAQSNSGECQYNLCSHFI